MGWAGIENGELLVRASSNSFAALVTKDSNLQYEQNLGDLPIAVIILHEATNGINDIRPLLPALLQALQNLPTKQITHVR
jgi:hypothetical protein